MSPDFWTFTLANGFAALGVFIFVELYNFYLLHRGLSHSFLGEVAGAMTVGSIGGTLVAPALFRRCGIQRGLSGSFLGIAAISAARVWICASAPAVVLAVAAGAAFAIWSIVIPVVIAQLTGPANRARGFSLFFSVSVSMGVLGDALGGELPRILAGAFQRPDANEFLDISLLIGCAVTALSLLPLSRLALVEIVPARRFRLPRTLALRRFFFALAIWTLAIALTTPFLNTFFLEQRQESIAHIGWIFSGGELAAAAGLLFSSVAVRKVGAIGAVPAMMLGTGVFLSCLGLNRGHWWLAGVYAGFMAFQMMAQPWLNTFLMSLAAPEERTGLASLNALIIFSVQSFAALIGGKIIEHFGYGFLLWNGAASALGAALLFLALLTRVSRAGPAAAAGSQGNLSGEGSA